MEDTFILAELRKVLIFKFTTMISSYTANTIIFLSLELSEHALKVSDLLRINFTQVKREKSSTHTNAYLLPPKLYVCMGPIRSI